MTNPEFKRNLWLQFSAHRLIAMPVILGLVFLIVILIDKPIALVNTGLALFVGLVLLWGSVNVSASIADELRDKTWDQQRMSALQPWTMLWGKLFGATAFNWYGGILCLLVVLVLETLNGKFYSVLAGALTYIALAILIHAATLAFSLHTSRNETRISQRARSAWLIVFIIWFIFPSRLLFHQGEVKWWGYSFIAESWWLAYGIFFALIAVFGAWRVMSNALQVRTLPWAWPLFALILTVYFSGFDIGTTGAASVAKSLMIGTVITVVLTYAALLSEPNGIAVWQSVVHRFRVGDWRRMLQQLPLWVSTLALCFVFAIGTGATLGLFAPTLAQSKIEWLSQLSIAALVVPLLALRDVGVFLYFSFSTKPKRVLGTVALYLTLIYGLLPFLAKALKLNALYYFFLPFVPPHWFGSSAIIAVHAVIVMSLVVMRWRRIQAEKVSI